MTLKEQLYESLTTVAQSVADGTLGDSSLIKACQIYKWRTKFEADKKYNLIKAKTFNNFINGKKNSQDLMKALVLGETKDINGVLHVVKMTKSGKLDWRVANKQPKSNKKDGNAVAHIDGNSLFDNLDFPELSDVKFISKLGGSTGAELVEDANGDQYVLKRGASKEHIEEEFLTNSIYKLMGVSVPVMKLYQDGKGSAMMSRFMPQTVPVNQIIDDQFIDDITDHYVLDCLLANWDIYKNDNILVNQDNDEIVRVDNGGGLRFSATGRSKGDHFTDDVDEIESMLVNNPKLASGVTTKKINNQIKAIVKNKNKIIGLIESADLKVKMAMRIASLDMRLQNANAPLDPYRELSDKELDKAMKVAGSLFNSNDVEGWVFLSQIAKMRGFDGTPTVVDAKQFNTLLRQKDTIHVNRGITGYDSKTAKDLMNEFCESDHCFYGKRGIYGAGIYGAVNSQKKNGSGNPDWEIAFGYADYNDQHILDVILPPDMKIADADELDNMMMSEFFGDDFKEAKKEYDEAVENLNKLKFEKQQIETDIEEGVKKEMGWDEKVYNVLRRSKPEEVYADASKHKFEKVVKYFTPILNKLNGKVDKVDDLNYKIVLPNSSSTFLLNKNSSESDKAVKQKSQYSTPYNYQYKLLKEFLLKEHFHNIGKKIHQRLKVENETNPDLKRIKDEIQDSTAIIKTLSDNVEKVKTDGSATLSGVMSEIAKRPGGEYRGFYAAIKGYDAIIQKNGWGRSTDFCVILNRSKVIVKEFN